MDTLLVYGSYGYTGRLVAREAVSRGGSPVVAGRNRERVTEQADDLAVEGQSFALSESHAALTDRIESFDAVLNCAGPFVDTCDPLVEACLETGTDYLDITGEFEVFERLARADERAAEAGATVVPGVGFDVVPSDCLTAYLGTRLPSATDLTLGLTASTSFSRGTAKTLIRYLGDGGLIRRDGRLYRVPTAYDTREIDFGDDRGSTTAVTIPYGDVVTAYHSTGIENVAVYADVPSSAIYAMRASNTPVLSSVLGSRLVEAALERLIHVRPEGPSEEELETDRAIVWGEVTDGEETVRARLETPNVYALTADAAVSAAERVLEGDVPAGYQTPSTAFGSDFVLECSGVERELLSSPALEGGPDSVSE